MRLFLAGIESRRWIQDMLWTGEDADMQLYIAGIAPWREGGCTTAR